jgi:hypothetical protein
MMMIRIVMIDIALLLPCRALVVRALTPWRSGPTPTCFCFARKAEVILRGAVQRPLQGQGRQIGAASL